MVKKEKQEISFSAWSLLRRIMVSYVWPQRYWMALGIFFMLLAAGGTSLSAYIMKDVIDKVFVERDPAQLSGIGLFVIGAFLIKGFGVYGTTVVMGYVGGGLITRLRNQIYKKILSMDISFFHSRSVGELMIRVNGDADSMRVLMSDFVMNVGRSATTVLGLIAVMFATQWKLSIISLIFFPIMFKGVSAFRGRLRLMMLDLRHDIEKYQGRLMENFVGIHRIKAAAAELYETRRAYLITGRMFQTQIRLSRFSALISPLMEFFAGIAITIVILYGGREVIAGKTTSGAFFAFLTALLMLYEPVKRMASTSAVIQGGIIGAQRVFELLDHTGGLREDPEAPPLAVTEGVLEIENVSFQYRRTYALSPSLEEEKAAAPESEIQAVEGISLTARRGQKIAIVGTTGAGKSTVIKLIPRFYDVTAGRILIDGQDIRKVNLHSLRRAISYVSQDISLFEGTIFENVVYGTYVHSFESFKEATRKAQIWPFIESLPEREKTLVGTQGILLSGGQRQRLAIARAFLQKAPFLILDEATSAMDTSTERAIQENLDVLGKSCTTLIIAHRLSTIANADRIYVMEAGRIAECGSHEELLAQNGFYKKLCEMQRIQEGAAA